MRRKSDDPENWRETEMKVLSLSSLSLIAIVTLSGSWSQAGDKRCTPSEPCVKPTVRKHHQHPLCDKLRAVYGSPGDMPQHIPYEAQPHSYYYFRPYNHMHVADQQRQAVEWGLDAQLPYSNSLFDRVYAEFEDAPPPAPSDLQLP
jgi:hypothetical protein